MGALDKLASILMIIGGLNWGLVGIFDYNLVDEIFGVGSAISRIIYTIVGVAALYALLRLLAYHPAPEHKHSPSM